MEEKEGLSKISLLFPNAIFLGDFYLKKFTIRYRQFIRVILFLERKARIKGKDLQ